MTERLMLAAHRNGDSLILIGAFTTFEKAMEACDNFHISEYESVSKLNWLIGYKEEGSSEIWDCTGIDADGFDAEYYCEASTVDEDIYKHIADHKRKRAE